jgi:hypothetical protein
MRHEFVLAIAWLLVSSCSASPQDKAAPLAQDSFVGEWVGDNKDGVGRVFTRFVVSKKDNDWSIKAWFNNGLGSEGELKTVTLSLLADDRSLLADDRSSKFRQYGFATWELPLKGEKKGGITVHVILRSEKEKLVVETITIFTNTPGVNGRDLEKFKKK